MTDTAKTTSNYTPAMEQRIRDFANGEPVNLAGAKTLATEFFGDETKYRSVVAKITRMDDVDYARKVPTSKTGEPVQKKDGLTAEIADLLAINVSALDGLDKAPKAALIAIRNAAR